MREMMVMTMMIVMMMMVNLFAGALVYVWPVVACVGFTVQNAKAGAE